MEESAVKNKLQELRGMLEKMVRDDNLSSFEVLHVSAKIDELIAQYYRNNSIA